MQFHRNAARIAALWVAALVPMAGVVAMTPSAAGSTAPAAALATAPALATAALPATAPALAPAAAPTPATAPAPTAKKKKKKQQTIIAIGTRLAEGSSIGPNGVFIDMLTEISYNCLSPNGKKTINNPYIRNNFTEAQFTIVTLDGVTKKTGKKWTCTVSMTKPEWGPAGGKWIDPTWYKDKDGTFKSSPGTGWTITVKVPQGKVTYVRAMNKFTGKGKKYKPVIKKVPDIWANSSLGIR